MMEIGIYLQKYLQRYTEMGSVKFYKQYGIDTIAFGLEGKALLFYVRSNFSVVWQNLQKHKLLYSNVFISFKVGSCNE